jgi:Zn-dependent M28 family amino/carboxypeptidase
VTSKSIVLYLSIIGILLLGALGWYTYAFLASRQPTSTPVLFDGQRAYADVRTQVGFGSRVPGTEVHAKVLEWIRAQLKSAGWQVEIQESEALAHPVKNIVAKRNTESPQIVIGAHYDTRMFADQDPEPAQNTNYVPGANDGASGVAVLLGLARSLPEDMASVWLVFFDTEDNGDFPGWDWILGSREFVRRNLIQPRAAIVAEMIGDSDLNIYKERNSNLELTDSIWTTAKGVGFEGKFIAEYKHSMLDDHTPLMEAGIPAVDIIDFDYAYWHTVQDKPDKVSAVSLQAVGETLRVWLLQQNRQP